ncbi:tetratricopeptide repeat protein [Yoonia sp. SS1-5]|uniref:Tetratricopeptide repeat protein n=1 Tax=Yoonia rhodophyticola TaxID=3137370 RepID=A0AAN0NLK6_9RHOB
MKWIILPAVLAPPAFADICPPVADHSARLGEIIVDLGQARGQGEAQVLSQQLWSLWTDAPDAKAQALLDEGMRKRSSFDFLGARDTLDALVEYCPDYAEGYNQRAFASYLRQDFEAALIDLDKALSIMPNHIAALSGKGLTLMGLGRHDEAQDALRAAVEMNPWLQERALLVEPPDIEL